MSSNISTDELFHYTKFENLLGIIEKGFYPRYNLEYVYLSDFIPHYPAMLSPVAMVCFCDIPLTLVENHIDSYGKCAIGLTKRWGASHGINPVLYIIKDSIVGITLTVLAGASRDYKTPQDMGLVQRLTNTFEAIENIGYFGTSF